MPYLFAYPPQSVALDHYNFILEYPGDPWVRSAIGGEGYVGFRRMFPFMILSVKAMNLGDDMTSEALADDFSVNSVPETTVLEVLDRRPLMVNGVMGIQLRKRYMNNKTQQFAVQWLCAVRAD